MTLADDWPVEKPVRFHFPRKKPGCKDGYLSWANENTCCFLCLCRRKLGQLLAIARGARKTQRAKPDSREFQMSLHGTYEELRDDSWFAGGIRGKK